MKKVLLLFLTLIMVSCVNKVKVSDLHYEFINGLYTITVDGKPFDGVAWGEDGESFSVKVINGMLLECVYYDTDGVMYWKYDGEDENFYDKNGKKYLKKGSRNNIMMPMRDGMEVLNTRNLLDCWEWRC
jgi:hypothetical protein